MKHLKDMFAHFLLSINYNAFNQCNGKANNIKVKKIDTMRNPVIYSEYKYYIVKSIIKELKRNRQK